MKGRPVDQLVYEYMFPKPRSTDPQNFHSLLHRHLILEVRQEVHSFYGHLDTPEAKYPGLDYTHRIHRIRLSRWPWHRRLFRAFDGLRLTHAEISSLTKWEGTKWAKERFEKDAGITIVDTADEGFSDWVEPEDRPTVVRSAPRGQNVRPGADGEIEGAGTVDEEMLGEEEESEEELESIGTELNERLRERARRREAGDPSASLEDEEWEQWLKTVIESGGLPFLSEHLLQQSNEMSNIPQALFPRMMSAARAGNWREIPESLHEMLRRTLECEALMDENGTPVPEAPASRSGRHRNGAGPSTWSRPYSSLRLPIGDGGTSGASNTRLHRTARPGA